MQVLLQLNGIDVKLGGDGGYKFKHDINKHKNLNSLN